MSELTNGQALILFIMAVSMLITAFIPVGGLH